MADGGFSSLSAIDENHKKTSHVNSQTNIDQSKGLKGSFLTQIKKRLSFRSTNAEKNNEEDQNVLKIDKIITKNEKNISINVEKMKNRFFVIFKNFGKGRNKENLLYKDLENNNLSKNREFMNGGFSSLSAIDENHKKTSPVSSQTKIDPSKRRRSSFLAQIKKRLSFRSKNSKKNSDKNNQEDESVLKIDKIITKNEKNTSENVEKSKNRFSVIRKSFGKGKNKENLLNKDLDNNLSKNRESMSQNQIRPQSMHIANSYPPRNGLLASYGWYWGPLSRSEATHRLRHQDDGSFLVRDSEGDPNKFTLSFKGAGQIFHNRILHHQNKYAFLPDEEFDSIPDLIDDAMRRSATSAYCFSRSTDVTVTNPSVGGTLTETQDNTVGSNGQCNVGTNSTYHKHEVRLLKPVSRFIDSPRSLFYLCRFMIRQYTRFQDLCILAVNSEIMLYLQDSKYNL